MTEYREYLVKTVTIKLIGEKIKKLNSFKKVLEGTSFDPLVVEVDRDINFLKQQVRRLIFS